MKLQGQEIHSPKTKRLFQHNAQRKGRDVAPLVQRRNGTLLTQVRFPGEARDFSPRVDFQCRLSYGVRTSLPLLPHLCAIACIIICAHVKDPVVYVWIRWIVEALKYPARTAGGVARVCRSWLSPGKADRIPMFEMLMGRYSYKKKIAYPCTAASPPPPG